LDRFAFACGIAGSAKDGKHLKINEKDCEYGLHGIYARAFCAIILYQEWPPGKASKWFAARVMEASG
jgi:hypothetical protein